MEKEGIHFIVYKSSAKQQGNRKTASFTYKNSQIGGDWQIRDKKTNIRDKVYEIDPQSIRNVYSEKQDFHNIQPQSLPSQMNTSLTPASLEGKIDIKALEDMQETLYTESVIAPEKSIIAERLLSNPENPEMQREFIKNLESIGVPDVLRVLRTGGLEKVHDEIYKHILSNLNET